MTDAAQNDFRSPYEFLDDFCYSSDNDRVDLDSWVPSSLYQDTLHLASFGGQSMKEER